MASGNTLLGLFPLDADVVASNYATLDYRNLHPVLDFDAATDESAVFTAIMPRHYAGGGLTVYVHIAFTSATSGVARFDISFERIGSVLDIDADSFATAKSVEVTADATSGVVVVASLAFTDGAEIDSIAAGEAFRIKIVRDANHANDTAAGDAELVAVEIKET